jgi:hypothetical protein
MKRRASRAETANVCCIYALLSIAYFGLADSSQKVGVAY